MSYLHVEKLATPFHGAAEPLTVCQALADAIQGKVVAVPKAAAGDEPRIREFLIEPRSAVFGPVANARGV